MTQSKMVAAKTLASESEQAINFLTKISDLLKHQRRHFDDAVVTHCIRLINDYVEEKNRAASASGKPAAAGNGPSTQ